MNVTNSDQLTASNSTYLKANQPPKNGQCSVDATTGLSVETNFTISCIDWVDGDGSASGIANYEFYCKLIVVQMK